MSRIFGWCAGAAWMLAAIGSFAACAVAGQATVAVAGNFAEPARIIAERFHAASGHEIRLSAGSTGALYAQIRKGAPYDAFLAADQERPGLLVGSGDAAHGSQFTYAIGRLVLWSRDPGFLEGGGEATLRRGAFRHLAIANPKLAPYGAAAVQVLSALGVLEQVSGKLVQGQNVGQVYQFVASGSAPLGLVALSQVSGKFEGARWVVPDSLHDPIRQDAVLLRHGAANSAAADFLAFLRSDGVKSMLETFGYGAGS